MSNSKGVYVGAVLRCEVEKVTEKTSAKYCPSHGFMSIGDYCSVCGAKTEHRTVERYPFGHSLLDEYEGLYWLPSQQEWKHGVLYFCSNIIMSGSTNIDADPAEDGATVITPELMKQQIKTFSEYHAQDIAVLAEKCKTSKVVWAVVPWYEF